MPEEPGPPGEIAAQRELLSRLRAVVQARDAENALLRAELDAGRELRRRLELRLAEPERRLPVDSSDSGTPSWHSLVTPARWCRIKSYLDSAAAHGITALHAIRDAPTAKPWLPPLPAIR